MRKHVVTVLLRRSVYPTNQYGVPAFLIPEDRSPTVGEPIEIKDVPDRTYHINVSDEVVDITLEEAKGSERELIGRMLERPFTDKLTSLKNVFWKDQWTLFYFHEPANGSVGRDVINAYRGFKFGVVLIGGKEPYLTFIVGKFPE